MNSYAPPEFDPNSRVWNHCHFWLRSPSLSLSLSEVAEVARSPAHSSPWGRGRGSRRRTSSLKLVILKSSWVETGLLVELWHNDFMSSMRRNPLIKPGTEVKPYQSRSVLGWETAREHWVLLTLFALFILQCSILLNFSEGLPLHKLQNCLLRAFQSRFTCVAQWLALWSCNFKFVDLIPGWDTTYFFFSNACTITYYTKSPVLTYITHYDSYDSLHSP